MLSFGSLHHRASLLAIRHSLFLLFFILLIFLFNSAILASTHVDLFGGCSLRGTLLTGSIVTLAFIDSSLALEAASLSFILSASLFILLIFFLLNPALVLLDALVIFQSIHLGFQIADLCIQALEFLS